MTVYNLAFLAEYLCAQLHGNGAAEISAVATLEAATSGTITFLSNSKYRRFLQTTAATAVLIKADDLEFCQSAALVVSDPYVAFAKVAQLLDTTPNCCAMGVDATAKIHPTAQVDPTASIGPYVVVEQDAIIAANVQIGAGCFVGQGAQLGMGTRLWPNVTVYHQVKLGADCLVHSGAIIGADGFGFANQRGQWLKIPQLGAVVIGDQCEIGANTTIDRGALADTVLGRNVILDNQVQIAHNVQIGDHTAIAGCTVVAGSTKIGRYCVIGGSVGINGHIEITDGVQITGMSMITKSLLEKGVYSSGTPASSNLEWRKNSVRFRQLDQMYQRLRDLEQQVAALQQNTVISAD